MPSIALTIQIANVSQYLASADVAKGSLFDPALDPRLPIMLYVENQILSKIYTEDSNYTGLQQVADYVYSICYKKAQAENIVNGGGGGIVPSPTSPTSFPLYITEADFSSATDYNNSSLLGLSLMVFLNEINRYLNPPTSISPEFEMTATGITITLPGFDATQNTYNIVIEKVNA